MRLSPSHHAGRYRIHASLADHPLGREEMLRGAGKVRATARVELVVTD